MDKTCKFELVEIKEDPLISQSVCAIYLTSHPRWEGVDSACFQYKLDPMLYRLFKQFLFDYFENEQEFTKNKDTHPV